MTALDADVGRFQFSRRRFAREGRGTWAVGGVDAAAAWCAAIFVLHALFRAVSYRAWADGPAGEHAREALFPVLLGGVAWLVIRATVPSRSALGRLLPWLTSLLVLAPGSAVHLVRLRHPLAVSGQLEIVEPFTSGADLSERWGQERRLGGTIGVAARGAVLTVPAGGAAVLDLNMPPRFDVTHGEFWLPRGLYDETFDEGLNWEAAVVLERDYFAVLETRHLRLQVTPFGLHITYLAPGGRVTEHHVELPSLGRGESHRYRLERRDGLMRLRIDDTSGWVTPDAGQFGIVRFGETRPDPAHGGQMTLRSVHYVREYPIG